MVYDFIDKNKVIISIIVRTVVKLEITKERFCKNLWYTFKPNVIYLFQSLYHFYIICIIKAVMPKLDLQIKVEEINGLISSS